ncbi:LOW QUALITY PROTEIN: protein 60A-like [Macrobrachium rosenbergii]|uniref:LOW QUALITY PROTEIN: protein 60A-like n=1 Tax=Macrobrachium rosenbergii TaxID=79674 RepID=UPI0034D75867
MKVISVCLVAVLLLLLLGLLQEISARATAGGVVKPRRGDSLLTDRARTSTLSTSSDNSVVVTNTRAKYPLFGVNSIDVEESKEEQQQLMDAERRAIRNQEAEEEEVGDEEEEDDDDEEEDEEDDDVGDRDYEWSEADLEMIKQKILDGLGMTTVPEKSKANFTKEEYDLAYSEYIRLVQEEEARISDSYLRELDEEEDDEEERDLRRELGEDQGSAMPSLSDYRFYSTGIDHHGRGRRSARVEGQIVHFHVAVPVRRVYSHDLDVKQATCRLWKTGGPAPEEPGHDSITVSVFKMDDGGRRRRRRKQDPVLIQSLNVSVTGDEWLSVDVTEAVKEWVNSPKGEAGVLVQCPDCPAAGVTIHTGASSSNTSYVPTLDVQTQVAAGRRVKRSKELTRATKAKWRRRGDCRNKRSGNRRSRCCRRSMKVRFKDLPSFDFVTSPEEFDAYYCSGRCPARFNPANEHALLQSLLKMQRREEIPRPCCAPTALQGLHILHVNEHGKLTTTYWSDVIVTECGCA